MAYLPGQLARTCTSELSENACKCGKPSELKVVGETDSFGSEFHFMCRACYDDMKKQAEENPHLETCPRCKAEAVLIAHRDPDEGSNGPLYYLCGPCLKISNAYYLEGLSESERGQDQDDHCEDDDQDDDPWTPEDEEAFQSKLDKDEEEYQAHLLRTDVTDGEQA
jgi:hypothetical protein